MSDVSVALLILLVGCGREAFVGGGKESTEAGYVSLSGEGAGGDRADGDVRGLVRPVVAICSGSTEGVAMGFGVIVVWGWGVG